MKNSYRTPTIFMRLDVSILLIGVMMLFAACEQFIEIDPPRTALIKSTVFETDVTANGAMVDVYYEMAATGFATGSTESITFLGTILSDEQINYGLGSNHQEFNDNELTPKNVWIQSLWSQMYKTIYKTNAILEGVAKSTTLSGSMKMQLEGEAKFIRAFCYFYLTSLYGEVPLITTTDYRTNSNIGRSTEVAIRGQIIDDLLEAYDLLADNYSFANGERVRATKSAATALLARFYLYIGDFENAAAEASKVMQNTALYALVADLNSVFLKNSTESILQFHNTFYPFDYLTFRVFADFGPVAGAFRPEFLDAFEPDDQRMTNWVRSVTHKATTYFFPGKYKAAEFGAEYSTLFRLAEMYLIRAEARAQLGDITGSQADLNIVRHRAGLGDTPANDRSSLIVAVERERVAELFSEQGLRWLDLKRTNRADAVLEPLKGSTWQSTDVLFPIPEAQILNDPAMQGSQNPGY